MEPGCVEEKSWYLSGMKNEVSVRSQKGEICQVSKTRYLSCMKHEVSAQYEKGVSHLSCVKKRNLSGFKIEVSVRFQKTRSPSVELWVFPGANPSV